MGIIDTSKVANVAEKLEYVLANADAELYAGAANTFLSARGNCSLFSEGYSAEIDIVDFCNQYYVDGVYELQDAVKEAIASVGASKAADVAEADREKVLALLA